MHPSLIAVPTAGLSGPDVTDLTDRLRAALDGRGPAVLPTAPDSPTVPAGEVPDGTVLAVRTSGSSGAARTVLLGREAVLASATATHDRLGGPGRWLLALPVTHVAGAQVLVRSLVAGTDPVVLPGRFDPVAWVSAVRRARPGDAPVYAALVPTQLHRVVGAVRQDATLARTLVRDAPDALLLGGAAAPASLVHDAEELGLRVVRTYGMTETAGGCVYDGVPLAGVAVRIGGAGGGRDDDGGTGGTEGTGEDPGTDDDGVVELAGPVLATGYLGRPDLDAAAFVTAGATRWFRTQDLGAWDGSRLRVLGRRDDVVVTGGVKVAPAAVESVLSPYVPQVCVVGVPDEEWGSAVVAVVTGPGPGLSALRAEVTRTLGRAAAPRQLVVVDELPERGPGKVDRALVARWAAERVT